MARRARRPQQQPPPSRLRRAAAVLTRICFPFLGWLLQAFAGDLEKLFTSLQAIDTELIVQASS